MLVCFENIINNFFEGRTKSSPLPTAEIFTKDGWKKLDQDIPNGGVEDHCIVLVNSTSAMIIGGQKRNIEYSSETTLYHFDSNTWTRGPDLNIGRERHSCGMVKKNNETVEVALKLA